MFTSSRRTRNHLTSQPCYREQTSSRRAHTRTDASRLPERRRRRLGKARRTTAT